jgi:hypothetical protein
LRKNREKNTLPIKKEFENEKENEILICYFFYQCIGLIKCKQPHAHAMKVKVRE